MDDDPRHGGGGSADETEEPGQVDIDPVDVADGEVEVDVVEVDEIAGGDEGDGDEGDGDEDAGDDAPGESHIAYDLAEWAGESRSMLRGLLETAGIPHAWEGTTLVVPEAVEADTDELVEQVEVTTLPTLDPDQEPVAYDLGDWSDEQLTLLQAELQDAGIPYEFDVNGDLVSTEDHQEALEALIDEVEFPGLPAPAGASRPSRAAGTSDPDDDPDGGEAGDDGDGEGAEGAATDDADADDDADDADDDLDPASDDLDGDGWPDGAEVLSDLFIAADRLQHHGRDADGVLGMVAAARAASRVALPYGFDPKVWADIVGRAEAIRDLLEADGAESDQPDPAGDEEIQERATELRTLLREFV